ncbi:hypothetical protein SAMN05444365_105192 [Micromonospora pattaloongensis]|uniref:Uncharacterized protein n=1 Tax=Micromonospora pattaloongensis TaxID=405436 RepID=A0A1H3Q2W4_9ACTN|nr:hypothetical protein [Micromonospora pattaloongensis]SDZ07573.1 hypothetical protein SAMN05444365_105192 [Micromonospora pattaloongensis]
MAFAKSHFGADRPTYCEISTRSRTWRLFPGAKRGYRCRPSRSVW